MVCCALNYWTTCPRNHALPTCQDGAPVAKLAHTAISGVSHMTRQWKNGGKVDAGQVGAFV